MRTSTIDADSCILHVGSRPRKGIVVLRVRGNGERVTPVGHRIAKVGHPVTFEVASDRPGGLQIHSYPEQTPDFLLGADKIQVTIDKQVIVWLQVS